MKYRNTYAVFYTFKVPNPLTGWQFLSTHPTKEEAVVRAEDLARGTKGIRHIKVVLILEEGVAVEPVPAPSVAWNS